MQACFFYSDRRISGIKKIIRTFALLYEKSDIKNMGSDRHGPACCRTDIRH